MLNRKIPVKIVRVKLARDVKHFSVWQLLTFAAIFAVIGGYLIYHSFAFIPCDPDDTTDTSMCDEATTTPTSPISLKANPVSASEIDLSWTSSASTIGLAGYNVYMVVNPVPESGDNAPSSELLVGQTNDPSAAIYKITGLESGTSYAFYVKARDNKGNLSAPSNQAPDTTLDDPGDSGSFALRSNTAATSSTWPYKSPFGDKSCIKNVNSTPTLYIGCICQTTGGVTCDGSCVDSAYAKSIGIDTSTYVCRPGGVFQLYSDAPRQSRIQPNVQDEGVDYNVFGYPYPKQNSTPQYMYPMGKGVIINITTGMKPAFPGNGSFGPNWIAYRLHFNGPGGSKGPADGLNVYIAHYCTLASNAINDVTAADGTGNKPGDKNLGRRWKVGDSVTANSILCTMDATHKPVNGYADSSGKLFSRGIEIGWSGDVASQVLAKAYYCYGGHGHIPTQYGFSFSQFIHQSGGPKGLPQDGNHKLYTYPNTHLHYYPCPPFPSEYKGSWY